VVFAFCFFLGFLAGIFSQSVVSWLALAADSLLWLVLHASGKADARKHPGMHKVTRSEQSPVGVRATGL
jgi:type IV secretory pathway TrbD component